MRRLSLFAALVALVVSSGCQVGVTEADSARLREEFSQENYEKAMKAAGKTDQLEAEKQAEDARNDNQ